MAIAFRCCSGLWPKNISWIASDQCCGKKFSDLFTGSYRLIQFNNYKGSMRSWLRMKTTASWTDISHLSNQDGKSSFSALRWHILYIVIILTLVFFFWKKNNLSLWYWRSRWLWSRLITQPSTYAPVKGLYLYGGVGTGKTMLMDLFYEQL